jgi:CO/xanthine dehydrogenase Mo-binding subunit
MADYHVIGKPAQRVNANLKVAGKARYSTDIDLPGTLWRKSLHSPYAHARIVSIDTTAARRVPGVHAVITGADVRAGLRGGRSKTRRFLPATGCDTRVSAWRRWRPKMWTLPNMPWH